MMTLKMRAKILEEAGAEPDVLKQLEDEISASNQFQQKRKVYNCCLTGCTFKTGVHSLYVKHLKTLHSNTRHRTICKLKGCERDFTSVNLLEVHLKVSHYSRPSLVKLAQNQIVEKFLKLKCLSDSCHHQNVQSLKELKKHLNYHFERKEAVFCIFSGCKFQTDVSGSMRDHLSKRHKQGDVNNLKAEIVEANSAQANLSCADGNNSLEETLTRVNNDEPPGVESDEATGNLFVDNDAGSEGEQFEIFMRAIAITFNDWMNIRNIPYSTCNLIIQEVFRSYSEGKSVTQNRILKILQDENFDEVFIRDILDKTKAADPFEMAKEELESEYKRLRYVKENFEYNEPETVFLDEKKIDSYVYIPVIKSLKTLLEDDTYIKQKLEDGYFPENGVYKDVRDGEYFKSNRFFQANPEAVPLLMFQDELEIANPLGSGKTKHKMNMTYFTTYEVQSALRSKIQSVQLVSIVKSKLWKKHGNMKTNRRLLSDLKILETDGIVINKPVKKTVKAGLMVIVGDNLGLHQLSELNCCFSNGHICRICKVTYEEVCKQNLLYSGVEDEFEPELFTEATYDALANKAETEGGGSKETCGIKANCIFNSLESFHCTSGMPPCLGHDFFEGCFSYDIQFLLDFIINKEKLLTADQFNSYLTNCKLSERDSRNRPNLFKTKSLNSKYEGGAGQLRVLSRIITILLAGVIDESEVAGELIIKLQEVAEIVTAPQLNVHEIDHEMKEIIEGYLDSRISAISSIGMPHARPKHHFLAHYGLCYKKYGPLISLWAMRMESKHTYFKGVIKASKNFKNAPKTCASRHELAQVSYRFYGLFPISKFDIPANSLSLRDTILISEKDAYLMKASEILDEDSLILTQIKIFGTLYSPGMVLVMKKESYGVLKVGIIRIISFKGGRVTFGCSKFTAMQSRNNFYVSTENLSSFEFISYDALEDYYPLQRIGDLNKFRFSLHHYISSGSF